MKKINLWVFAAALIIFGGCTDLDVEPREELGGETILSTVQGYESFLAKIYAGLAVTGQQGPAGSPDITLISDEGFSSYVRVLWKLQELPTEEAVTRWGDVGIRDFNDHSWGSSNNFSNGFYSRVFFQIGLANEFLRQASDDAISSFSPTEQDLIRVMRADARFLRALSYYHALDAFRNIPFFTDLDDFVVPEQADPQEVFDFLEQELIELGDILPEPRTGPYGRADRGAAWTLLAKLYLNGEVYTGEPHYSECITYCDRVIASDAYTLSPVYQHLFLADNHTSPEIIFPIPFGGNHTRTFGGMTFLTHMPVGPTMPAAEFGLDGGWSGMRTTSGLVDLFPDENGDEDTRSGIFWTDGHNREITDFLAFEDGYGVPKFKNITSDGAPGQNPTHPDTDFPLFRLADVHLMYAEAVLRGGSGGTTADALRLVNDVRERAYGNAMGNIGTDELTLDFMLDERARELFWEAQRRTDLVRFDQFTENGVWPWKGGVPEGQTTEAFRNIFPLPDAEIIANRNLDQNPGY